MRIVFDESRLTLADFEDFYDYAGRDLELALKRFPVKDEEGAPVYEDGKSAEETDGRRATELRLTPRDFTALVWILRRLDEPEFTVAEARKMTYLTTQIVPAEDDDPKDSAEKSEPEN